MAVNVGQRNVPDTPANRQLDALQKAQDLALHTIKITANQNIFRPEYQNALTNDIIRCAKDIYIHAGSANDIRVDGNKERLLERLKLQRTAIRECGDMLRLIDLARRLFRLKGNKVRYWSGLTRETAGLLTRWHESDLKRYRDAG